MNKKYIGLNTLHKMESFGIVDDLISKIRITKLEDRVNPKVPFPHKHNFYFLLVVTKGSGWHEIDFNRYPLKRKTAYFMHPSQIHKWHVSKDVKGLIIEFEIHSLQAFFSQNINLLELLHRIPPYINLAQEEFEEIVYYSNHMYKNKKKTSNFFDLFILGQLLSILTLLGQSNQNYMLKIEDELIVSLEKTIESNLKYNRPISFYGNKLQMSTKSLSEKIKRKTGLSLRNYIQQRIFLEAKRMLAYSDLSIKEVCAELGIEDVNYFSRLFKQKTKMTPNQFRKNVKS